MKPGRVLRARSPFHPLYIASCIAPCNIQHSNGQDPDRHCFRPPSRKTHLGMNAPMKCASCYDHNKGVTVGCCDVCGHKNRR